MLPHGIIMVVMMRLFPSLNVFRGLLASSAGALLGACGSVALAFGFMAIRWWAAGTTEVERQYDVHSLEKDLVGPVIGCAVIFACTGWATFAPVGNHRVVRSLVIIFLSSVLTWWVLLGMEVTPHRYKSAYHPIFYPSELLVLVGPPVVVAVLLTAIRVRGVVQSTSSPGDASVKEHEATMNGALP